MAKFTPTPGRTIQAFQFAVDPTPVQRVLIDRHFGARRKARNWTVEHLKADIDAFHATGEPEHGPPSLPSLRKRWNEAKNDVCVDRETGEIWWNDISKEAFADGVKGAVDAYWRWHHSRSGNMEGRKAGFPKFKKRGRDQDRYTITTGAFGVADRHHVKIPKLGRVRVHENMRKIERLIASDRARILSMTVRRRGNRILVSFKVEVARPQQPTNTSDSTIGIDVGVRKLATVADSHGNILEVVDNPKALDQNLKQLRLLNRRKARRTPGSIRHIETNREIAVLHSRIRDIRQNHIHCLTKRLAKTHSRIVVEGLDVSGMMHQRGPNGARTRRRNLADSALSEPRRQLRYKCAWYGSTLVEADRWFPSSKTCNECLHVQNIGWSETWTCDSCKCTHDRDENAAINLARWTGDLDAVGVPVKQGADRKTGLCSADGEDLREPLPGGTPRDGVHLK